MLILTKKAHLYFDKCPYSHSRIFSL